MLYICGPTSEYDSWLLLIHVPFCLLLPQNAEGNPLGDTSLHISHNSSTSEVLDSKTFSLGSRNQLGHPQILCPLVKPRQPFPSSSHSRNPMENSFCKLKLSGSFYPGAIPTLSKLSSSPNTLWVLPEDWLEPKFYNRTNALQTAEFPTTRIMPITKYL